MKKSKNKLKPKSDFITTTVLKVVEDDINAFLKKLSRVFLHEMVFTKTFRVWEKKKMGWRIKHLSKLKRLPAEIAVIGNIIKVLDKYYPSENEKSGITYGNKTVVETAVIIYDMYHKKIWYRMRKKFVKRNPADLIRYSAEEALAEQKARGFIHSSGVDLDPKLATIQSNVDKNYIWPKQMELNIAYEKSSLIAVSGFTGVKPPRSYGK